MLKDFKRQCQDRRKPTCNGDQKKCGSLKKENSCKRGCKAACGNYTPFGHTVECLKELGQP